MQGRLVVKPHRPHRLRIALAVFGIAALVAGYLLYEKGRVQGGFDRVTSEEGRVTLQAQLARLEAENSELRQQIAVLETSREVDREAYDQVEATLAGLQTEIQEQREELDFYRGIVTPADGVSGLRIQEFSVSRGVQQSLFRLHLVLVQAATHDRAVSGVVNLSVDGAREGKAVSYGLAELSVDGKVPVPIDFSFRYFQDFEREVVLPSGFVPDRVTIEVTPKGRTAKVIRQSFTWAAQIS